MPEVHYTTTIAVDRATVWAFVRDINNWAPFAKGYESHEVISDDKTLWTVKGDVGPISRTTKFEVHITEWLEGERVRFTVKGLNEPISGEGAIVLSDSPGGTDIRGDASLTFGGNLGPVINQLVVPWIHAGADELVTKIAVALQPDYVKPRKPFIIARWAAAFWNTLRGGVMRLFGRTPEGEPSGASANVSVSTPAATSQPSTAGAPSGPAGGGVRVETLLLGPMLEQYSGGGGGMMGLSAIGRSAAKIEELGFDGLTTPEAGHDPFLPLTLAAEHTKDIALGTNVAIAFPRSPMVTAQIAWDLQQQSGGRFQLGLGTQVKGHNERRYSTPWTGPPGPRLREYLLCLKAIFHAFQTGEPPSFDGEHYRFTLMSPFFNAGPIEHPHVPLYIAALNTYMARMAGEICDGVRLHPLGTFPYTRDIVIPAIQAGARRAGRDASAVDVVASPFLVTGKTKADVEKAKPGIKQQIAFYSSTRTYHTVLEHHGWAEVGQRLHALSIEGKWQEMAEQISDEMLDQFATIGTYDELVPKLKKRWGTISDTIFLGLPGDIVRDEPMLRGMIEELHKS